MAVTLAYPYVCGDINACHIFVAASCARLVNSCTRYPGENSMNYRLVLWSSTNLTCGVQAHLPLPSFLSESNVRSKAWTQRKGKLEAAAHKGKQTSL